MSGARTKHLARQRGTTLIEVVVAITLLLLVTTLVYGALRFGANAQMRGQALQIASEDRMAAARVLQGHIDRLHPVLVPAEGSFVEAAPDVFVLAGTPDRLMFTAVTPPWPTAPELALIVIDVVEVGSGDEAGEVLRYRRLPWRGAVPGDDVIDGVEPVLVLRSSGTFPLRFAYYGAPERDEAAIWQERWEPAGHLPLAVRFGPVVDGGPAGRLLPELLLPIRSLGPAGCLTEPAAERALLPCA